VKSPVPTAQLASAAKDILLELPFKEYALPPPLNGDCATVVTFVDVDGDVKILPEGPLAADGVILGVILGVLVILGVMLIVGVVEIVGVTLIVGVIVGVAVTETVGVVETDTHEPTSATTPLASILTHC
jgi:hypothetical protein